MFTEQGCYSCITTVSITALSTNHFHSETNLLKFQLLLNNVSSKQLKSDNSMSHKIERETKLTYLINLKDVKVCY